MPTIAQFELAASMFDAAAQQVGGLTAAAEGAGASSILRGGLLGQQVPSRIAAAGTTARWCEARLGFMARTCRARAAIVADYAAALERYEAEYRQYSYDRYAWDQEYWAWWNDPYNEPYPSAIEPQPPVEPVKQYSWIEV